MLPPSSDRLLAIIPQDTMMQTCPPTKRNFTGVVNQWVIYDRYSTVQCSTVQYSIVQTSHLRQVHGVRGRQGAGRGAGAEAGEQPGRGRGQQAVNPQVTNQSRASGHVTTLLTCDWQENHAARGGEPEGDHAEQDEEVRQDPGEDGQPEQPHRHRRR